MLTRHTHAHNQIHKDMQREKKYKIIEIYLIQKNYKSKNKTRSQEVLALSFNF